MLECPLAALLALIVLAGGWWPFCWWWDSSSAGGIGLWPHLGRSKAVQDVMEKIDDGAETVVDQVWRNIRPRR